SANGLPSWIYYVVGASAGLVLGLALAFLLRWRRDLVRDSDIADQLGVPILTTVPAGEDAAAAVLEAYRVLRTAVIANAPAPHVLGVTALGDARPASLATHAAKVLADAKYDVLLIDADTSGSEVSALLDLPGGPGLAEAVTRRADARELLVERHGFSVLTLGTHWDDLDGLTSSPQFRNLVTKTRQPYDYVVLLTGAAGTAEAEAALLATDSVLLAVVPDRMTTARVRATMERFARLGIRPLGVALQAVPSARGDRAARHDEKTEGSSGSPDEDRSRTREPA
ncbi:MAG: hypothetical protein Q4G67_04485, partial [Actinomycetia bacterium]|nr:hypothetical protein [Actinomycetes bacterium]